MLSAAPADVDELRGRPVDGPACIADAHLVQQVGGEGVLIVRRERPRRGVLRPQRAGRDAAPVRQRRDRREVVAKVRQASEHLIAFEPNR